MSGWKNGASRCGGDREGCGTDDVGWRILILFVAAVTVRYEGDVQYSPPHPDFHPPVGGPPVSQVTHHSNNN